MLAEARPGQDFLNNWPDNASTLSVARWLAQVLCCCFTSLMLIIALIHIAPQVGSSAIATSSLSHSSMQPIIGTARHQSSALPFLTHKKVRFPAGLRRTIRRHNLSPSEALSHRAHNEIDPEFLENQALIIDLSEHEARIRAWELNCEVHPKGKRSFTKEADTFFKP